VTTCPLCLKTYVRSYDIKNHLKIHHNRYYDTKQGQKLDLTQNFRFPSVTEIQLAMDGLHHLRRNKHAVQKYETVDNNVCKAFMTETRRNHLEGATCSLMDQKMCPAENSIGNKITLSHLTIDKNQYWKRVIASTMRVMTRYPHLSSLN